MKKAPILFAVLMVFGLTSCKQNSVDPLSITPEPTMVNSFGDGGLLSNEPCTPPCFYGITPGVTTEEEARSILVQKEVFENCEEFDNSSVGGNSQGIRCNHFVVYFSDSMVFDLGFYPESKLTLGEIIAEHGEPDRLYTFSMSTPDNPLYGNLSLCFDHFHMIIGVPEILGEVYHVSQETRILDVSYLSSEENYKRMCYDLKGSQPWKGYGDYPVHYIR